MSKARRIVTFAPICRSHVHTNAAVGHVDGSSEHAQELVVQGAALCLSLVLSVYLTLRLRPISFFLCLDSILCVCVCVSGDPEHPSVPCHTDVGI